MRSAVGEAPGNAPSLRHSATSTGHHASQHSVAEDRILAAEQALQDTKLKLKLKGLKRQARTVQSMDEARRLQDDIRKVEGEQRRQRQEIFAVEYEIEARRDALIEALEKRLHRASRTQTLFTVRWAVS